MTEKAKEKTVTNPAETKAVTKTVVSKPHTDLVAAGVTKHAKMEKKQSPGRFRFEAGGNEGGSDLPAILPSLIKVGQTKAKFNELYAPPGGYRYTLPKSSDLVPLISDIQTDKQWTKSEFMAGGRGLWIMGIRLVPVKTGVTKTPKDRRFRGPFAPELEMELGLDSINSHLAYRLDGKDIQDDMEFDVYQFELGGQIHTYLLDKDSAVWLSDDQATLLAMPWLVSKRQLEHKRGAGVVLVGATLINCTCLNSVCVIGGRHTNSLFSDSSVNVWSENGNSNFDLPWGGRNEPHDKHNLDNIYLERSHVRNSELARGNYYNATITDSRIEGNNNVRVETSGVTKSRLKAGGSLVLVAANIRSYDITVSSSLQLANQTLENGYLKTESLLAPNKLCISTFENPFGNGSRAVKMVMTDYDCLELSGGVIEERCKLRTWKDDYATRDAVTSWVEKSMGQYQRYNDDPDQSPTTSNDVITKSLIRYMVDNIMSRIGVLKTAMQAIEVSRSLVGPGTLDAFDYF